MVKVRQAKISDYVAMIQLIKEFFKASNFASLEINVDVECAARLVEKMTLEHLMLVLETDKNEIVGGIGGIIAPFLLNGRTKMLQEVFFYVKDGFRRYSQLLLTELEGVCRELKLSRIIMAHPNDGNLEKMERFYRARGFKKLETHFIRKVNI